ncbi:DivIVA domain-containing protein [Microbacterium halimionae]|uniref:DivIVA domain-containing protein n=1 Tax=Microbacterium halimionae TaxID=1526413 RepID=A0A7W3JN47_9MICO|nr:DivIVA domain-containing protein [Microbacterium halimionae]MBA8815912.1 DivIVA domain-containing protein [Microbacterium halimionae]NII96115.1 DivIVA domain-containing protein [Microbacterium halimionae]
MILDDQPARDADQPDSEGSDVEAETVAVESNGSAAPALPVERGRRKGYEQRAVDAFLSHARAAFEDQVDENTPRMTSSSVRSAAFPLAKGGYVVAAVDAALGRLEDAFFARERAESLETDGVQEWVDRSRGDAQVILDRLSRRRGRRFRHVSWMRYGYRVDEVDIVADKISGYLSEGEPVTVEQVRAVAFRMQRGGYQETQVDAVLDAVVEVMLAVR